MRSAFVGIIGRPNVGKSTLLNAILGEKVAIATNKPQTTRNTIRGIYNGEVAGEPLQLVFLDTPGIHKAKHKLGDYMTGMALETLKEVDAVLFLVDSVPDKGPGDAWIVEKLKEVETPRFLVINKIDTMAPDEYIRTFEYYQGLGIFDDIFGICAKDGIHVQDVIDAVGKAAPEGPQYFPEDMITDHPERFLAAEIIREKLLLYLEEEVPHGIAVEIESFEESENLARISAVIYCERKSHKSIIIGKGGRKLKGVGKAAREDIEKLLGCKVFLSLWVKIKERWRDDDIALTNFGYREKS